uniref:Uncharacterized protein n=1 Tax=Glossina pallidipes TaxID=7398 RepID=A0A1A9Z4J0_GLOPL
MERQSKTLLKFVRPKVEDKNSFSSIRHHSGLKRNAINSFTSPINQKRAITKCILKQVSGQPLFNHSIDGDIRQELEVVITLEKQTIGSLIARTWLKEPSPYQSLTNEHFNYFHCFIEPTNITYVPSAQLSCTASCPLKVFHNLFRKKLSFLKSARSHGCIHNSQVVIVLLANRRISSIRTFVFPLSSTNTTLRESFVNISLNFGMSEYNIICIASKANK